jgi:hypothetical protein
MGEAMISYWLIEDILYVTPCPACAVGQIELYWDDDDGFVFHSSRFCPRCDRPLRISDTSEGEIILDTSETDDIETE